MPRAIRIADDDDVATLLDDAAAGDAVNIANDCVGARHAVARGHKIALRDRDVGDVIQKYGFPIGRVTHPIRRGDHVHTHNLATALGGEQDRADTWTPPADARTADATTFMGYRRADGRVATRNEIWILPTVGCVARTAERIAARMGPIVADLVDGVHAFQHPHGCSQLGHDLDGTRAILAGLARNPNAGGVLLVGLGCEENQVAELLASLPDDARTHVRVLVAQMSGDELAEGCAHVEALARAASAPRVPVALDALTLGIKCGGSDGMSGLTANPLVGRMTDRVTGSGGAAIITEIPEMFGAERMLMRRAATADMRDATGALIERFKRYFINQGEPISENPSPGNVAGGITTLEEKSLGAVQKAGRATITDVIDYGAVASRAGLTVLEAPGNDAVSCTALAAAGATLILFTTGRGTPLGFPVPTVKIASNHDLAARKPGWIDFDAGTVLDQGFEAAEDGLMRTLAAIASGAPTAAERNGERDIAIWKRGVTL